MQTKRIGIALLVGALTFIVLAYMFSSAAPISVLGDGTIHFRVSMKSANGELIMGSSGGGYSDIDYEAYSIEYAAKEVSTLGFIVKWEIAGENIVSLSVKGRLYHVFNQEQTEINRFDSSEFVGDFDLGDYSPYQFTKTMGTIEDGMFHIDFRMVVLFDAVGDDSEEYHQSVISDAMTWMYMVNGKSMDGSTTPVIDIEGNTLDDSINYDQGTGTREDFYDQYRDVNDGVVVTSISPLSPGGFINMMVTLVVVYAVYRSVK